MGSLKNLALAFIIFMSYLVFQSSPLLATKDLFFAFVLAIQVFSALCRNMQSISSLLIVPLYLIFDLPSPGVTL